MTNEINYTTSKMENKSFTATIEVSKSPQDVFKCLKEVPKWWSKDFEGSSAKLHDEFVILPSRPPFLKTRLIEVIPDKKIVWYVTESNLDWLEKDQAEWTGTKMIFELTPKENKTVINYYA
jgi:hypothetical protein